MSESKVDHNTNKKIAAINDFTGFGRCSLAVELPIISRLGIQCCPVPTAIFSTHTGFSSYYMEDCTDHFLAYTGEWKKLGLEFDGILTGFLGSLEQFRLVNGFLTDFAGQDTLICVDPVMGDNGKVYSTYNEQMCRAVKELVRRANVITPNLTEACILTGTPYHEGAWRKKDLLAMIEKLRDMGPDRVVMTGIPQGGFIANLSAVRDADPVFTRQQRAGIQRSGTGDIFSAIIAADAVNGVDFTRSVRRASAFIKKVVVTSDEHHTPVTDGGCFEEHLGSLHRERNYV